MKNTTDFVQILIVTTALALAGCSSAPTDAGKPADAVSASGASSASGAVAIKQYPMHGKVLSLDAKEKKARIDSGPIGDWMPMAMTMNYPIKDDAEFAKLTAGETIDATAYVQGDDFWVGDIKPAAK